MEIDLKEIQRYSREDYERWEGAWELICGIPYDRTPKPTDEHQRVNLNLTVSIHEQIAQVPGLWVRFESDWIVSDDTTVAPDLMIGDREITGAWIDFPPVLVVEILSPATRAKDESIKFRLYEEQRVQHYLMVDPQAKSIVAYSLADGRYVERQAPWEFDLGAVDLTLHPERVFA